MTLNSWLPFGKQDDPQKLYSALHEGVPEWMFQAFKDWQRETLGHIFDLADNPISRFHDIEQDLRMAIPLPQNRSTINLASSVLSAFSTREELLVLADYLLSVANLDKIGGWEEFKREMEEEGNLFGRLERILTKSGSKWTLGIRTADRVGLVQRVPEGVQLSADETMRRSGHAGRRLAEAWGAAFGINPDPSRAYALAVKAVEDAAIPVVSPNDKSATLGKINSQIRNTGDWSLPLQREDEYAPTGSTLLSMMRMLWAGQADRHGGNHDPKLVITQEAAEVAVMTAVTLVQWFMSGAVSRRG